MTEYRSQNAAGLSPALVDLPHVAKSAGYLAEWLLTDRATNAEVDAIADSVTEYLRRLVEPGPCPPWCTTDHIENAESDQQVGGRDHTIEVVDVRHGDQAIASVAVAVTDDLVTGARTPAVVLLEARDGLDADEALRVADGLRAAAQIVATGSAIRPDQTESCPDFCQTDHVAKAALEQEARIRMHEVRLPEVDDVASVSVVATDDLDAGDRTPVVVMPWVADEMTPDQAVAFGDYLLKAAAIARTGSTAVVDALATIADAGMTESLVDLAKVVETATKATPGTPRAWCVGDTVNPCDGTDCMSEPVDVLATAGFRAGVDGGGVRVGMVSTYAQTDENGQPGVSVYVSGPISLDDDREAWAVLTPAEARRYAAELLASADLAERA